MTSCVAGCGACCDPVVLPFDRFDTVQLAWRHPADVRWMLDDLTPMPYREGYAKSRHLQQALDDRSGSGGLTADPGGEPIVRFAGFYRCRHFDADTRMCTNYDNRPPVCRGFPWHGGSPEPSTALPLPCSFRADIAEPITPLDEYLGRVVSSLREPGSDLVL